jgi:non-ribosomal peptide synthetase component F
MRTHLRYAAGGARASRQVLSLARVFRGLRSARWTLAWSSGEVLFELAEFSLQIHCEFIVHYKVNNSRLCGCPTEKGKDERKNI